MIEVSVKYAKNFKTQLSCKNDKVLKSFMDYLRTEKDSMRIIFLPGGRKLFKKNKAYPKLYRKAKEKLTFGRGYTDYLAYHLRDVVKEYNVDLKIDYKDPFELKLSDKWHKIFETNPKGADRGQMQIDDFNKLVRNDCGIAELFTGYGKTELLLAIAECSGVKTVIQVPDNGILEEVISRAKQYNMDVGNCDWTKDINVINVPGFMRSKNLNDKAKEWLKQVKLSIGDECHHFSSASSKNFFALMGEIERSYGFSASTDVANGKKVKSHEVTLMELGPKTAAVVELCGPVRVSRSSKIPMSLVRVESHIANIEDVNLQPDWSNKLDQTIISKNMASVVSQIFETDKTKVFFIPIHKRESGGALYRNLLDLGYRGVMWNSEEYSINGEVIKSSNILKDLKERMGKQDFDFIMSTKMEGIDLPPKLNAIIPLVGVNYRMTVQPVGRSARGADIIVYLIYDRNNKIMVSQSNDRLKTIRTEYVIASDKRIKIEPTITI